MGFTSVKKPHLFALYKVAYRIAKAMKPHTLAEEVTKSCVVDIADIVFRDDAVRKLKQVALSNDAISRRIKSLSIDIRDQLISDLKASPLKISIQLDESTNVSNYSQLICFVRHIKEKKVEEEFLFCQPLPRTTTAKDVFKPVKKFFIKHNFDIKMIGAVCSDGALAMLVNRYGFAAMLKAEIPELKVTHCLLHRQALAFKTLRTCLKNTLTPARKSRITSEVVL